MKKVLISRKNIKNAYTWADLEQGTLSLIDSKAQIAGISTDDFIRDRFISANDGALEFAKGLYNNMIANGELKGELLTSVTTADAAIFPTVQIAGQTQLIVPNTQLALTAYEIVDILVEQKK